MSWIATQQSTAGKFDYVQTVLNVQKVIFLFNTHWKHEDAPL